MGKITEKFSDIFISAYKSLIERQTENVFRLSKTKIKVSSNKNTRNQVESPVQQIKLFFESLAGVQLKFISEITNAALDVSSGICL